MDKMGSKSSSDALHDLFRDYAKRLDELVENFSLREGSNGAAFAIGGKIVGADLFDKPGTLKKLWSKLVRSYAADALEEPKEKSPEVEGQRVTEWLKSASSAQQHWFDSPGVGTDVRVERGRLLRAMLVEDAQPVELALVR